MDMGNLVLLWVLSLLFKNAWAEVTHIIPKPSRFILTSAVNINHVKMTAARGGNDF